MPWYYECMKRRIKAWILFHFFRPANYNELMDIAGSLFPEGGQVEEDYDGQLMIYTGLDSTSCK